MPMENAPVLRGHADAVRKLLDGSDDALEAVRKELVEWLPEAVQNGEPTGPGDLSPPAVAVVGLLLLSQQASGARELAAAGVELEHADEVAKTISDASDRFRSVVESEQFREFSEALGTIPLDGAAAAPIPTRSPAAIHTRPLLIGGEYPYPALDCVVRSPSGEVLANLEADWEEYWHFVASLGTSLTRDMERRLPIAAATQLFLPDAELANIRMALDQIRTVVAEAESAVEQLEQLERRGTEPS